MATSIRTKGGTNFNDLGYWSGGALPADGDTVIMAEGSDDYASGENALLARDLALFRVGPLCRSNFRGSPLRLCADRTNTGIFLYEGAGELWRVSGATDNDIYSIQWRPSSRCRLELTNCDNKYFEIVRGSAVLGSDVTTEDVWNMGGDLFLADGADVVNNLYCLGGVTECERALTYALIAEGAKLIYRGRTYTAAEIVQDGGVLDYRSGDITVKRTRRGVHDESKFEGTANTVGTHHSHVSGVIKQGLGGLKPTTSAWQYYGSDTGATVYKGGTGTSGPGFGI